MSSPAGQALAGSRQHAEPESGFVRWDLVQAVNGVVVSGGTDVSTDAATRDTMALTGSGHAEPGEQEGAGGGTFVHRDKDGNLKAKGSYFVTGFVSWQRLSGGNFAATGLVDGIGNGAGATPDENEPSSGILTLNVRLVPDGSTPSNGIDAVLSIHCNLPQTIGGDFEGFTLTVGSFNFTPTANGPHTRAGLTLFHILR
jgi:hypothetical protein